MYAQNIIKYEKAEFTHNKGSFLATIHVTSSPSPQDRDFLHGYLTAKSGITRDKLKVLYLNEEREDLKLKQAITEDKVVSKATKSQPEPKSKHQKLRLKGGAKIVMVASCKGGVGKSTISYGLAKNLQTRMRVGLLDADIYGPSIPYLSGCNQRLELNENGAIIPFVDESGMKVVSMGSITDPDTSLLWRGPMITKSLNSLILKADWSDIDVMVVDLPPGTGDIYLSLIEQYEIAGCVIVTTAHELSISQTKRTVGMLQKTNIPIMGLVENMSSLDGEYILGNSQNSYDLGEIVNTKVTQVPFLKNSQDTLKHLNNLSEEVFNLINAK